ncbi:MAG: cytochrome c [bacterium]
MSRYLVFLLILFFAHNAYPSIDEGKKLFTEKRCVTCHVVGRGKFVGPDLWNVSKKYNKSDLIQWINNPDQIYEKYGKKPFNNGYPPMPNMNVSTSESIKIISYLNDISKKVKKGSKVSIKGTVNNYSSTEAAEYEVQLDTVMADKVLNTYKVSTSEGYFLIDNLEGNIAYKIKIFHDGIEYSTDKFYFSPLELNKEVELTVYDSTMDSSNIEIESTHLVVNYDDKSDVVVIAEIFNIYNNSNMIFFGSNDSRDPNREIIELSLFNNIEELNFPHRNTSSFKISDDSIIDTIPLPPGGRRIVFTYVTKLDLLGTTISKKFLNKIPSLTIIVPEDKVDLKIEGLEYSKKSSEIEELKDQNYVTYSMSKIEIGDKIELSFSNFQSFFTPKILISAISIIVIIFLSIFFVKKRL